jgi:methionine sulfoxide reductase heme-binding subunit
VKSDPTFWMLARATGLTAYVLLTTSILAGLVLKSRPFRSLRPAAVTDTHRFLALLGLGAVVAHGATLALDPTLHLGLRALLIPGLSPYRPVAVGSGVLAAELMLVVYASFSLRRRIGARNWRRLHWATYGIFCAATAHGLAAGTDTAQPWAFSIYLSAIGLVVAATTWRALMPPTRVPPTRVPSVPVSPVPAPGAPAVGRVRA